MQLSRLPISSFVSGSALALALCLAGCGSSEDDATDTPGSQVSTGIDEVGKMQSTATTCTKPNTICMNMQVPMPMQGTPTNLQFDIYDSASPPSHLPNGIAGIFRTPTLTPGAQMYFELTDGELQGDYWMWVIMYMEGGGYGAPVSGVDYIMHSAPAVLHLDGSPLNIAEPVVLGL